MLNLFSFFLFYCITAELNVNSMIFGWSGMSCKTDLLATGAFLTPSYTSLSSSVCDACTATVNEIESVLAMDELEKLLEDISGIACSLVPYKPVSEAVRFVTSIELF